MHIRANLPLTLQEYQSGTGEVVWVRLNGDAEQAYREDSVGSGYRGSLASDSLRHPKLKHGKVIEIEKRERGLPVVSWPSVERYIRRKGARK